MPICHKLASPMPGTSPEEVSLLPWCMRKEPPWMWAAPSGGVPEYKDTAKGRASRLCSLAFPLAAQKIRAAAADSSLMSDTEFPNSPVTLQVPLAPGWNYWGTSMWTKQLPVVCLLIHWEQPLWVSNCWDMGLSDQATTAFSVHSGDYVIILREPEWGWLWSELLELTGRVGLKLNIRPFF